MQACRAGQLSSSGADIPPAKKRGQLMEASFTFFNSRCTEMQSSRSKEGIAPKIR